MLRNLAITLLLAAPVAVGLVLAFKAIDASYGVVLIGVGLFAAVFGYIGSLLEEHRRQGGPGPQSRHRPSGESRAHA